MIKDFAPKHHADANAPDTYEKLTKWASTNKLVFDSLPVYDGASDNTIYSCNAVNYAFRAWHDALHIIHGLGFTPEEEKQIGLLQMQAMVNYGASHQDAMLVYLDVCAQVDYYKLHGEFVYNQQDFIAFVYNGGKVSDYNN